MSVFRDRIAWLLHPATQESEQLTPPNSDLRVKGTYGTPSEMPLVRIQILPGVIAYEEMQPLITSDGAPIPATSQGQWGQLYAAGRIH